MSDYKVQWSVSLPPVAQYAKGHMLNIAAESVDELAYLVGELNEEVLQALAEVASNLVALSTAAEGLGATPVSREENATTSQSSNVTPLRTCEHGKRTRREGDSAKGHWVGYFCPRPKGSADQCKAIFEDA